LSRQHPLEEHFASLLSYCKSLWLSYKNLLAVFAGTRSYLTSYIDVQETQDSFRIALRDSLERAFFSFKFESISPLKEKRVIEVPSGAVVVRGVSFLPAYSFSLDSILTLIYWGQRQALFEPGYWQRRNLLGALITAPSEHVHFSLMGAAWPRSITRFVELPNGGAFETAQAYLFNALPPPPQNLSASSFNACSFTVVGDEEIKITSIYKSLFTLLSRRGRAWAVRILANDMRPSVIECEINHEEAEREPSTVHDGLILVSTLLRRGRPSLRTALVSIKHPISEEYGVTLTLLSIALRSAYLHSKSPILVGETAAIFKSAYNAISQIGRPPKDVASLLLSRDSEGVILPLLGAYAATKGGQIAFIHPYFLEVALKYTKGDLSKAALVARRIFSENLKCILPSGSFGERKFRLALWLRENLDISDQFKASEDFISAYAQLRSLFLITKAIHGACPHA